MNTGYETKTTCSRSFLLSSSIFILTRSDPILKSRHFFQNPIFCQAPSRCKMGSNPLQILSVSVHLIITNHGTTSAKQSFSLGCSLELIQGKKSMKMAPHLELLVAICHQGHRRGRIPMGSMVCARTKDNKICGHTSEKLLSEHHWGLPKSKSINLGKNDLSPYHGHKLPTDPHPTPTGLRGLVVDYIMFTFSGNMSVPH
jgi:hypothetical protein